MRALYDQNLPRRLVRSLADIFPDSIHLAFVSMERAEDASVWDYAKANGCLVVSKDRDFADRVVLEGPPPKVI